MTGLQVIARRDGASALQVSKYTADSTRPILESCSLDLTAEEVTLIFSETVWSATFSEKMLSLQRDETASTVSVAASAPSKVRTTDSPVQVIKLSKTVLNEIKRLTDTGFATAAG